LTVNKVVAIDHKTAKPFIEKWHYFNRRPTGSNTFFIDAITIDTLVIDKKAQIWAQ
jgi:hypothetical protein